MKKIRNKKVLIAIVCLFVVLMIGSTFAFFTSSDYFGNLFNTAAYRTVTTEEFISPTSWTPGDETAKTITTKNEGTIPVRIRVKFVESWTSANNESLDLTYNGENVAIINLDHEVDWIYKDGYYYYLIELAPGDTASSPLRSVTFNPNAPSSVSCTTSGGVQSCQSSGNGYDGGTYKLTIVTEIVQSEGYDSQWETHPIQIQYEGAHPCTYVGELDLGTEYVNGQYTYHYRQEANGSSWSNTSDDGWGVRLTDSTSTSPITSTICSSINGKPIVSMSDMYYGSQSSSINLSTIDSSNVTNMYRMFSNSKVTALDLSPLDTSKVMNMSHMFSNSELTSAVFTGFKVTNVLDMSYMFHASKLSTINISGWNAKNAKNFSHMFSDTARSSVTLNLNYFYTNKATDMSYMFSGNKATTLNLNYITTTYVTNFSHMFASSSATSLNVSRFNTTYARDMSYMFADCLATSYNFTWFLTRNVTDMSYMFAGCRASTLDLSYFDTRDSTNMDNMFLNALTTTGYAKTQADADRLNATSGKPSSLVFTLEEDDDDDD